MLIFKSDSWWVNASKFGRMAILSPRFKRHVGVPTHFCDAWWLILHHDLSKIFTSYQDNMCHGIRCSATESNTVTYVHLICHRLNFRPTWMTITSRYLSIISAVFNLYVIYCCKTIFLWRTWIVLITQCKTVCETKPHSDNHQSDSMQKLRNRGTGEQGTIPPPLPPHTYFFTKLNKITYSCYIWLK